MAGPFMHSFRQFGQNLSQSTATVVLECSKKSFFQLAQNTLDSHTRAAESINQQQTQQRRLLPIPATGAGTSAAGIGNDGAGAAANPLVTLGDRDAAPSSVAASALFGSGGSLAPEYLGEYGAGMPPTTAAAPHGHQLQHMRDPHLFEFETDLSSLFELSMPSAAPAGTSALGASHFLQPPLPLPQQQQQGLMMGADDSTQSLTDILDSLLAETSLDTLQGPAATPPPSGNTPSLDATPLFLPTAASSTNTSTNTNTAAPLAALPILPSPSVLLNFNPSMDSKVGTFDHAHAHARNAHASNTVLADIDTCSASSGSPPASPRPTPATHFAGVQNATAAASSLAGKLEKPKLSYAQLCAMALWSMTGADRQGRVEDIYKWISDNYPYYQTTQTKYWRNSIRHTLSTNRHFNAIKPAPRGAATATAPAATATASRGSRPQQDAIVWELSQDAYTHMVSLEPGKVPTCLADRRRNCGTAGRRSRIRKRSHSSTSTGAVLAQATSGATSTTNKRLKVR